MRSFIKLLILLLVILVGIGFYRGWFSFHSDSEPKDGKVDINVSVDKAKMKSDIEKAEGKVKQKVEQLQDKVKAEKAGE